jgi:hypothetical protein
VLRFGVEPGICVLEKRVGAFGRLNVGTVIDVLADGDVRSQLGQASEMITVPMGCDYVIDLLQAGGFRCVEDTPGIAADA